MELVRITKPLPNDHQQGRSIRAHQTKGWSNYFNCGIIGVCCVNAELVSHVCRYVGDRDGVVVIGAIVTRRI
eukprot:2410636-Pyramimonas_sp.AAC.1